MSARRGWLPAFVRRDPDIGRVALLSGGIGAVAGFVAFCVLSSRGLDLLSLQEYLGIAAFFVSGGLFLLALARIAMFQDYRIAAVLIGLLLGSVAGDRLAFVVLPGNTTDGQIRFTRTEFGHLPPPTPEHAKCTWDQTGSRVVSVESRRPTPAVTEPAVPGLAERTRLELGSDQSANVTITVLAPMTSQPVYQYSGRGALTLTEASGRVGSLSAAELPRSALDPGDYDPELLALIDSLLAPAAMRDYEWSCPALP